MALCDLLVHTIAWRESKYHLPSPIQLCSICVTGKAARIASLVQSTRLRQDGKIKTLQILTPASGEEARGTSWNLSTTRYEELRVPFRPIRHWLDSLQSSLRRPPPQNGSRGACTRPQHSGHYVRCDFNYLTPHSIVSLQPRAYER
jgi:hypothetical protein